MAERGKNELSNSKQVLIIEDHPVVAETMRLCLSRIDAGLCIVISGCAEDAIATFHRSSSWFRIFLDLDIPGAYGLSLVRQFAELGVADRCTVVTATDNGEWKKEAASMGLLGYIVKTSSIIDFTASLEATVRGNRTFTHDVMSKKKAVPTCLTGRQQDVLCLLHRGYTSKEIARQLSLNTGTVDNHVTGILRALKVTNRTHAIAKAIEFGFVRIA